MPMDKDGSCFRWLLLLCQLAAILVASHAQATAPAPSPASAATQAAEAQAMISLRWNLHMKERLWPRRSDPCSTWAGISCDAQGHVVGINLSGLVRNAVGQANPTLALDALQRLPFLNTLNASRFTLRGSVPEWFGGLQALLLLDLTSASVNGSIPESFGNLINISVLILANNNLAGPIPSTLGNLRALTTLNLSSNGLTGQVPTTLRSLGSLSVLDLSANRLEGPILTIISELPQLQHVSLAENLFNSSIPAQLGNLAALIDLDLSSNSFSGRFPPEVGNLTDIRSLDLSKNFLEGPIPEEISNCLLLQTLALNDNIFNGSILQLGTLTNLLSLDLSFNNLTGFLPSTFSDLAQIQSLLLSNNLLYGPLPDPLLRLPNLATLDVSSNFFNGTLPVTTLRSLASFENCLTGLAGQRSSEVCQSFYMNLGLPFESLIPPEVTNGQPTLIPTTARNNKHVAAILIGVATGLGLIAVVITLLLFYLKHERTANGSREAVNQVIDRGQGAVSRAVAGLAKGETFSYAELERATNNFSPANMISEGHSGILYKGFLDEGAPIVVKRVDFSRVKREGFVAELEMFRKASHTRLIPLTGHCLERTEEKFLVYKFMPNGDLAYALHRKGSPSHLGDTSPQSLDWITRLKIALGAAEGLAYLHHECSPAFVHRDIKASSILLDDKFEVRLGSLSESCPQQRDSHSRRISQLFRISQSSKQGDLGGVPTASCSYDVFCFGKVLLELISGRLGISDSEEGTDAWLEWALPQISPDDRDSIRKLLDPSLNVEEDLLEEVWAMGIIAKSCLHPRPSKRPNMRHISKALENPVRVVRDDNGSGRIRASPRSSRSAIFFESWRHSSSETVIIPGTLREEHSAELNPRYTTGTSLSQGSQGENPPRKAGSSENFPDPVDDRTRYKN